jgi:hypothetical protein
MSRARIGTVTLSPTGGPICSTSSTSSRKKRGLVVSRRDPLTGFGPSSTLGGIRKTLPPNVPHLHHPSQSPYITKTEERAWRYRHIRGGEPPSLGESRTTSVRHTILDLRPSPGRAWGCRGPHRAQAVVLALGIAHRWQEIPRGHVSPPCAMSRATVTIIRGMIVAYAFALISSRGMTILGHVIVRGSAD